MIDTQIPTRRSFSRWSRSKAAAHDSAEDRSPRFSVANDVTKYFAILPAMFMEVFPEISPLNVMRLASAALAILSAVIFNAIIIVLLMPLALRGVKYRPIARVRCSAGRS